MDAKPITAAEQDILNRLNQDLPHPSLTFTVEEIRRMKDGQRSWITQGEEQALRARVAELEDAILDWHREDRGSEDQDRASMRLYNVAEEIRLRKGLDLGHNRVWTGPGELERTGYLEPGTTPYPETKQPE